ncbi:hypothetical protein AB6836_08840 [Carnobacterium divergens]|uniref:hypothetical protein n=1 Tax=Carnobacterium divergens TaxID=2748 RepID=UPI0039C8DBA6
MKIKKITVGFTLIMITFLGACGSRTVNNKNISNEVSEINSSKEKNTDEIVKNDELGNYKGLKIGDTIPVKYSKSYNGKYAFDFTLNKVEYTEQSLGGEEPGYETGFIIADITIKNTGKEELDMNTFNNINYGSAVFVYGKKYGFTSFDEMKELKPGESNTGKMVTIFSKVSNTLTRGLEGTSTVFSYDIKADEIGDYVPE